MALVWFRKGLRLLDNPALHAACSHGGGVFPVFVLDPWFANPSNIGQQRYAFLLESLTDLDTQLRTHGLRLLVVKGTPTTVLPALWKKWGCSNLSFEFDSEPYAKRRDQKIMEIARKDSVEVSCVVGHTLHDPRHLFSLSNQKPPTTYQSFLKLFAKASTVPAPLPVPEVFPLPSIQDDLMRDENEFGIPSLTDMGYPALEQPLLYPGGETEALARMERSLEDKKWVRAFEKPKTAPNSLMPSTTVLSPYLKFGCLSARVFYHKLADIYKGHSHSKPPVSLHGQLLWREFFYLCGHCVPNFDKMKGNPICKQIDWDYDEKYLAKFENAQTGYPFIDAIMTQLKKEGWIHHLARHAVACFLTRGDLYQSWESGVRIFDRYLLDADWSLNNANWMWLSCSSFFHMYYRCYSPVAFGKKTDKNGDYIRKYLPHLKKFPKKYIFEPWTAPKSVQIAAGCIIGEDYPAPMVEHKVISKINIGRMKAAYAANGSKATSKKSCGAKKSITKKTRTKKPTMTSTEMSAKKSLVTSMKRGAVHMEGSGSSSTRTRKSSRRTKKQKTVSDFFKQAE